MLESTLVIVKPDGMDRGLLDEISDRIRGAGLDIADQKEIYVTREQAERLYREHKERPFYRGLVEYIMSGRVAVLKVAGDGAVAKIRSLMGSTDPRQAEKGTIRGDLGPKVQDGKLIKNTVHGSDSVDSAKRELGIFFV